MCCRYARLLLLAVIAGTVLGGGLFLRSALSIAAQEKPPIHDKGPSPSEIAAFEDVLPDESLKIPFKDDQPIYFVTRGQNAKEWESLKSFWNEGTENVVDPKTGEMVTRKIVKIKVPLGLNSPPPVPAENPLTVAKWKLGKDLYFDGILSSDRTVSCATCHDPAKGYTDQLPVSTGIRGKQGGVSAPTVFNSAYNFLQFWDGRASSLEDQSQGPPQNALEMFDGGGHAWYKVVQRIRNEKGMPERFKFVFGTPPTRDTVAKAIAAYERTVLTGNSVHDRAELAMRKRVEEEETGKLELQAKDYAKVLKEAIAAKDAHSLEVLGLSLKDGDKVEATAKALVSGRNLFFGKARCNSCHVGDNFTDNSFHNLGVGAKDGKLLPNAAGRYGALPTGHKNLDMYGAFKTPMLRKLLSTAPYMHDGSEKTLEAVIDFYDKGGNPNPTLDIKMRDEDAERAWYKAKAAGKEYTGKTQVYVFNGKPIAPLKLNLTPAEKKDLVLFLKALEGEPLDPVIAAEKKMPK